MQGRAHLDGYFIGKPSTARSPHERSDMRAMRRGVAPDIASLIRATFASLNPAADPTGVKRLFALLTGVATFRHTPLSPSRDRGGRVAQTSR